MSSPEASTVTVGSAFGSSCIAEAVGVPKPAGEPSIPFSPAGPCSPCAPVSPLAPLGIPKMNLNILAMLVPEASTDTVGASVKSREVTSAVGVPNPAAAPVSPLSPFAP